MKKNVTIKDIAQEMSVSPSTVSRALNDDYNVSKEMKQAVQKVAERLQYKRNKFASNLRSGKTMTVGIIVPDMNESFFFEVYKGILSVLSQYNFMPLLVFSENDTEQERKCLQLMQQQNVDGIIMCVCHEEANKPAILSAMKQDVPFVFFDRLPNLDGVTKIEVNNERDVHNLVEHLYLQGFRRFAYVKGQNNLPYARQRFDGFLSATKLLSIYDETLIFEAGDLQFENGVDIAKEILDRITDIEAIIASDDLLALGIMQVLQSRGIKIPDDVVITGIGGSNINEMVYPRLTTISFPKFAIGEKAAKCLMQKISDPNYQDEVIELQSSLVLRESTDKKLNNGDGI